MVFDDIYRQYWDKVYRLCMGYVNDRDWANDIAQDTFVTVWQQLPSFRQEAAVGTWIFRIASNNCIKQLEKSRRLPRAQMPENLAGHPDPDKEAQLQLLQKFIAELHETDRLIILLELEGLPQAEIADVVGISDTNTRVRLHRIKEKLSKKFRQYER